jgi:tyrosinase
VNADRTASLNYRYDGGGSAPAPPSNLRITESAPVITPRASASEPVRLGASRTRARLGPAGSTPAHGAHGGFEDESSGGRLYLVLGGITAPADAGTTYNVYLDLPDSAAAPGPDSPHYLGTLGFFGAAEPGVHAHAGHRVAFNVTHARDVLGAPGQSGHMLTFVRHGDRESFSPAVGEVVLAEA